MLPRLLLLHLIHPLFKYASFVPFSDCGLSVELRSPWLCSTWAVVCFGARDVAMCLMRPAVALIVFIFSIFRSTQGWFKAALVKLGENSLVCALCFQEPSPPCERLHVLLRHIYFLIFDVIVTMGHWIQKILCVPGCVSSVHSCVCRVLSTQLFLYGGNTMLLMCARIMQASPLPLRPWARSAGSHPSLYRYAFQMALFL